MDKLYCYVDESGQDTKGTLFIVSVVLVADQREHVARICEAIELETGKGRVKWIKTRYDRRLAYIRRIFGEPSLKGRLTYAHFEGSTDYLSLTIWAIAQTILASTSNAYKATVFIDGLPRSQYRDVANRLRHLGIAVKKVRGVKHDENDALIRLADALCGLVRSAAEGQSEMQVLLDRGKRSGYIRQQ